MEFKTKIMNALRFGPPVLFIQTEDDRSLDAEIARAGAEIRKMAEEKKILAYTTIYKWTFASGLFGLDDNGNRISVAVTEPAQMSECLAWIQSAVSSGRPGLYILQDLDEHVRDMAQARFFIKQIGRDMEMLAAEKGKSAIIGTGRSAALPALLQREIPTICYALPDRATLREIVDAMSVDYLASDEAKSKAVDALRGLTELEAKNALAESFGTKQALDIATLLDAKAATISSNGGAVTYYKADATMQDVGGLGALKGWIKSRADAFSEAARKFGLPPPRGILMTGLAGMGKSLAAKAMASMLGLPLLRFDMGAAFGSLVGESEAKMRQALAQAESMAPCLFWMDEIEKAMSGTQSSGSTDGGTTARVFGTFLTWMQEKQAPVFVVMTANDISNLPPEFLRRGRIDEIFFLDLPGEQERREILKIHLAKRGRNLPDDSLDALAKATDGFVGAEIEQVVIDGLYLAWAEQGVGVRDLSADDIHRAISSTVPQSRMMAEKIEALRKWARTHARLANSVEEPTKRPSKKRVSV